VKSGICWCCRKENLLGDEDLCFSCWFDSSLVVAAYLRDLEEFSDYKAALRG
jgi:hypothetical protein